MPAVFHLRGVSRERVIAAVEQQLRSEGFEVARDDGDEDSSAPRLREVVVRSEGAWIGVADDPHASTAWGERFSKGLGVDVLRMDGECDHAFYSNVALFRDGTETARNDVPEDAVHGEDGRHRITPTFLASIVPDAAPAIEAGIVVNRLGGQENVVAVGKVLGIARPLVREWRMHDEPADPGEVVLRFRYAGDDAKTGEPFGFAEPIASEQDPLGVRGILAGFGIGADDPAIEALASDPMTKLLGGMFGTFAEKMKAAGFDDDDDGFVEVQSREIPEEDRSIGDAPSLTINGGVGRVPLPMTLTIDVGRSFSSTTAVKGLRVELSGSALELVDTSQSEMTARFAFAAEELVIAKGATTDSGTIVFDFPDVVLEGPSNDHDDEPPLPAAERLRQRMRDRSALLAVDRGRVTLMTRPTATQAGQGELRVGVHTIDPPSSAFERHAVTVERALRMPPILAHAPFVEDRPQDLAAYAERDVLVGWMAWETSWPDVAEIVVSAARDLARWATTASSESADGFAARVLMRGGEHLEFPAPVVPDDANRPWKRILTEIARGADVDLEVSIMSRAPSIKIVHQPTGSNYFEPEDEPQRDDRAPAVVFSFLMPRADDAAANAGLAAIVRDVLARAGGVAGSLGGFASCGGGHIGSGTPFEMILGTYVAARWQPWLRTHTRIAGYAVLAPRLAALAPPEASESTKLERTALAHGTLLVSRALDPFSLSIAELEASERAIAPGLGTPEEIAAVAPT